MVTETPAPCLTPKAPSYSYSSWLPTKRPCEYLLRLPSYRHPYHSARRPSAMGRSLPGLPGERTSRGRARCARRGACRASRSAPSPTPARSPRRPRWPPARRACRERSMDGARMACAWHAHGICTNAWHVHVHVRAVPAMARIAQRRRPRDPNMAVLAADVGALRVTPLELVERERLEVHAASRGVRAIHLRPMPCVGQGARTVCA